MKYPLTYAYSSWHSSELSFCLLFMSLSCVSGTCLTIPSLSFSNFYYEFCTCFQFSHLACHHHSPFEAALNLWIWFLMAQPDAPSVSLILFIVLLIWVLGSYYKDAYSLHYGSWYLISFLLYHLLLLVICWLIYSLLPWRTMKCHILNTKMDDCWMLILGSFHQ